MISKDLDLLPVMKDNRIVGVVRSVDAFNEIAAILLEE
jgi:predicted transcriptional regulator